RRVHRAAPGAEVLRGEIAPGKFAQVRVDVVGGDRLALAERVEVLEELGAGKVAAALHDAGEPLVGEGDVVLDAALSAEAEAQRRSAHRDVPAPQRRQAERAVLARVLVVAYADQR